MVQSKEEGGKIRDEDRHVVRRMTGHSHKSERERGDGGEEGLGE